MSTITPQSSRPPTHRDRRDNAQVQAPHSVRDHWATLTVVSLVLLVGAVAVLWFAVLSGSEPDRASSSGQPAKTTRQELRELARGSDRHLYQRQPGNTRVAPDGSDRHLYQRQPGDTSVAPDGSDQHLYLLPHH